MLGKGPKGPFSFPFNFTESNKTLCYNWLVMREKTKVQKFEVVLEADSGGFHVAAPALKGCHSWGATREEALENIEEAIEGCVETLRRHGHKIPETEIVEVQV